MAFSRGTSPSSNFPTISSKAFIAASNDISSLSSLIHFPLLFLQNLAFQSTIRQCDTDMFIFIDLGDGRDNGAIFLIWNGISTPHDFNGVEYCQAIDSIFYSST